MNLRLERQQNRLLQHRQLQNVLRSEEESYNIIKLPRIIPSAINSLLDYVHIYSKTIISKCLVEVLLCPCKY